MCMLLGCYGLDGMVLGECTIDMSMLCVLWGVVGVDRMIVYVHTVQSELPQPRCYQSTLTITMTVFP